MQVTATENLIDTYATITRKLAGGYTALKRIEAVEVGATPKELIWHKGRVLLYKLAGGAPTCATPLLVVYALVNRHHMMDLQPDKSFLRNLLEAGRSIYLIDWGDPAPEDRYQTMGDYINGYLNDCVAAVMDDTGMPQVSLMGICQGGTFSAIYAALHPHKIKNLVTLVTPIDFHTPADRLSKWARYLDVDALVDHHGNIPGALLNTGFEMLKPMLKVNKYVSILNAVDKEAQLLNFLRMELWIGDSPSQAGECFRQFIKDLYQQNKLVQGSFVLDGKPVQLQNITMPLLNIYAAEDHLVPPDASIPLNGLVGSRDTTLRCFAGGHIGVFVGTRSQQELAPGIASWLKERDHGV